MAKNIVLGGGEIAVVDDDDYERLMTRRWCSTKSKGQTTLYAVSGKSGGTSMHREVMNAPPGIYVDHINANGLDNRKTNLRFATNSQNQQNRHLLSLNTSGFRGVTFHKQCGKWQAGLKLKGKTYHLGLHKTKEDAARAYDEGARRLFGEFARLNFPIGAA